MKRGKPQQQIYRPGSGPLRKSTQGIEESESDTKLVVNVKQNRPKTSVMERIDKLKSADSSPRDTNSVEGVPLEKFGDMSISDSKRKSKKPEQTFYVPRPVAQARDMEDTHKNGMEGGSNFDRTQQNKSKRYSNRRRTSETSEGQHEWRVPGQNVPRNLRQGSEPRGISSQNSYNRSRDTRSVEPSALVNQRNYNNDSKISSKPPSGRRHSTIGLEPDKRLKNLDNLPPRFKKKYLEDNNLTGMCYLLFWIKFICLLL